MDIDLPYATTLVAAVLLGIGFVLQQYSAEQEPDSRFLSWRILTDLLGKPRWLLGIACMVAGYVCAAWSIGHLELTLVEPLLTTYLVWALVLAVPLSRQRVKLTEVVGAVILIIGVTLISVSRSIITPIGLSFGSVTQWYAAAIIAGVAFVAVMIGHRRQGQVRATLTGLAAGLVFGIQDALTRQTLEALNGNHWTVLFSTWAAYALVGAGIVGIWLMQNAFSAAPLHASLPAIAAAEPLAGITLGILVFGDTVQTSPGVLAIQALGIAALIIGVIAVARSSAFGGLGKITEAIRPGTDSGHRTPHGSPDHGTPEGSQSGSPDGQPAGTSPGRQPAGASPDGQPAGASPDHGTPHGSPDHGTPEGSQSGSPDGQPAGTSPGRQPPGTSPDGQPAGTSPGGRPAGASLDGRTADGSSEPNFPDAPPARKFSRPAHRREVHDSASGGEGR